MNEKREYKKKQWKFIHEKKFDQVNLVTKYLVVKFQGGCVKILQESLAS